MRHSNIFCNYSGICPLTRLLSTFGASQEPHNHSKNTLAVAGGEREASEEPLSLQQEDPRMGATQFFNAIQSVLHQIAETQHETISQVAKLGAASIANDRLIVLFGSGHSFLPTMDTYPRIGSFPGWLPIHELSTSYLAAVQGNQALRQALYLEKVSAA
jgi:hypothetical protein